MADAAYSVFFAAVLLGGASFLHVTISQEWKRISAALRGEAIGRGPLPESFGQVTATERPQPILRPVEISICRI
jgi:hypothetical protein